MKSAHLSLLLSIQRHSCVMPGLPPTRRILSKYLSWSEWGPTATQWIYTKLPMSADSDGSFNQYNLEQALQRKQTQHTYVS